MANINALSQASIPVYNVQVPAEGPLHIPLLLNFTANPSYFIDGKPVIDSGNFSMIQTIWIDAINATANVIVVISGINQTIIAKPGTQGYYPVLVPNPFHITISCASVSSPGALVTVSLINVPIAFGQWPNGSTGPAGPAGPAGPTGPPGPVTSVGLASTDLTVSGSPITSSGNITANLATTAVTPGTYGDATHVAQFTVDSKGRLTAAGNVTITAGTVSSVGLTSTSGDLTVTGSPITSSGNINADLSASGVAAATYGDATHVAQITVDSKGRLTSASNVGISAGGGGLTFLGVRTASSSSELDFTSLITSLYDDYLLVITDLQVSVAGAPISIQYSTNNGVSYDTANNYGWSVTDIGGIGGTGTGANGNTPWGSMIIFADSSGTGQPSSAGPGMRAAIWLTALNQATEKLVYGDGIARYNGTGFIYRFECGMLWNQTSVVNAVRLIPSNGGAINGNFPSGAARLYGLQKS